MEDPFSQQSVNKYNRLGRSYTNVLNTKRNKKKIKPIGRVSNVPRAKFSTYNNSNRN